MGQTLLRGNQHITGKLTCSDKLEVTGTTTLTGAATTGNITATGTVAATTLTGEGSGITGIATGAAAHGYATDSSGDISAAGLVVIKDASNQARLGRAFARYSENVIGISSGAEAAGAVEVYDQMGDVFTVAGLAIDTTYYMGVAGTLIAGSAIDAHLANTGGKKIRMGYTTDDATEFVLSVKVESPVRSGALLHCKFDPTNGVMPIAGAFKSFARGTTGASYWRGGVLQYAGTQQPRIETDSTGAPLGVLIEPARTNAVTYNRDLTNNAGWPTASLSNMTVTRDATGIDGIANSATTLTATGADATVQSVALTAFNAKATPYSFYCKRKTGTGAVTWSDSVTESSDISGSINSSTWTRIEGNLNTATPTLIFKLATSGDEVEIDYVQGETINDANAKATSPIWNVTAAVTRAQEFLKYHCTGGLGSEVTAFVHANLQSTHAGGSAALMSCGDFWWAVTGIANTNHLYVNGVGSSAFEGATAAYEEDVDHWYMIKASPAAGKAAVTIKRLTGTPITDTEARDISDFAAGMDWFKSDIDFVVGGNNGGSQVDGHIKEILILDGYVADADEAFFIGN